MTAIGLSRSGGRQRQRLPWLLWLSLLALPAAVKAQFNFITNNGTITITRYTGPGGAVVIPPTITELRVTEIGEYAFGGYTNLTKVTIPSTIKSIGSGAFASCTSLTNVIIPYSVTNLGGFAFANCSNLIQITIGNGVPSIQEWTFQFCGSLTNVTLSEGLAEIGYCAFEYCSGLAGLMIPNSVTTIDQGAFGGCSSLTELRIGNGVTSIGYSAFGGCRSLVSITIPSGVTNIGANAFAWCDTLSAIAVDTLNSAYSSVDGVLFDKGQTQLIDFPKGRPGDYSIPDGVVSIGDAFNYCLGVTGVIIPGSVTNMGYDPFYSSPGLSTITVVATNPSFSSFDGILYDKSQTRIIRCPEGKGDAIDIPSGTRSIGVHAFESCSSVTSVTIPNTVTNVEGFAFYHCDRLIDCTIGDGVATIGWRAFSDCGNLSHITIPGSVTVIAPYAFEYCSALSELSLVNGLNDIGHGAFGFCTNLGSVSIPNSVTNLGLQAFVYCTKLSSITIPSNIETIRFQTFYGCSSLTNATIPDSVTSIDVGAFGDCGRLTEITTDALNHAYSSADGVLFNKSHTVLLQYPAAKVGSYIVPSTVTNIPDYVFSGAVGLTGLYFRGNAPSLGNFVGLATTVYYLPTASGWSSTFAGRPTAFWLPRIQAGDPSFGVQMNQFGFHVSWASGQIFVVQAATNLVNPVWVPLQTNTLASDSFYFSDPEWTNHSARLYRIRAP